MSLLLCHSYSLFIIPWCWLSILNRTACLLLSRLLLIRSDPAAPCFLRTNSATEWKCCNAITNSNSSTFNLCHVQYLRLSLISVNNQASRFSSMFLNSYLFVRLLPFHRHLLNMLCGVFVGYIDRLADNGTKMNRTHFDLMERQRIPICCCYSSMWRVIYGTS